MQNTKASQNIVYMIRHLLTANITDPLSESSRGLSEYTQYFSGTAAAGQINYLERDMPASGKCIVKVGGVEKSDGTDYDLSRSALTITWSGTTPASGSDNITVEYLARKQWIYDDHPNLNTGTFPRISVDEIAEDFETYGLGTYTSYASGPGDKITALIKIIVRNRKSNEYYSLSGINYKNMDLVNAISESIITYLQTNRQATPWKFWDWTIVRAERIRSEEDQGIFRKDITAKIEYFHTST